ncbi:unnamed protein product [Bacillus thuringiensis DB27]|uniref:Uncharacterized protein n=1 Tax=Bacillus thuringiensis DB27 TaxID=1431339 RepID=W8ZB28_BACTU|nr:unnamed protein product [Bacillus thuringiensis DB27]
MNRLVKYFGESSVLTTEKDSALLYAFKKLQKDDYYLHTRQLTIKHRNNFIEQDIIDMSNVNV